MMEIFSYGKNKFILGQHTCAYVYRNDEQIATFDQVVKNSDEINIDHFAVAGKYAGKKLGKDCLELLARSVKLQCPDVKSIKFELYRKSGSPSQADLQKLADARQELLIKVGAINVAQKQLSQDTIKVSGEWLKPNWPI